MEAGLAPTARDLLAEAGRSALDLRLRALSRLQGRLLCVRIVWFPAKEACLRRGWASLSGEGASRTCRESWPCPPRHWLSSEKCRSPRGPWSWPRLWQGRDPVVVSLPGLRPEGPGTFVGGIGYPEPGSGIAAPRHTTWGKACTSLSLCPGLCRVGVTTAHLSVEMKGGRPQDTRGSAVGGQEVSTVTFLPCLL